MKIRNAKWSTFYKQQGQYIVRNRGAQNWYSDNGNLWSVMSTDLELVAIDAGELHDESIRLHGGPSDGLIVRL